jgi:hypothetical protein
MKSSLLRCALIALPLLSATPAIAAYDPAIVSSDARWVVHADFNALRTSTLGRELITAIEKAQTQTTGGFIGISIPKLLMTVGTLTAYGTNLSADPNAVDGALIAQGTADLRKIAESVLLQGTIAEPKAFSEITDLPFPAYAISDPHAKEGAPMQVIIAFPPEPIIVISKSRAQLLKARDVFRGAAPSMAKTPGAPLTKLSTHGKNAYLFAATVVPTDTFFPQNAPQTRILQLANSGSIAFGEDDGNTFAHAELLASSDHNAEKLMKILQGMTAVLSLAESNDQQLSEFLNATKVTRNKETVTLHLAYSSARLVQMTQTLRGQMEERPVNRPPPPIINGKAVAEWRADEAGAPEGSGENALHWRTIENVKLANGSTITVGRALNGGKDARFDRVEIMAAQASGTAPLVFRREFMRNVRNNMWQFQFPGADGTYTLKVAYSNDPDGKAKFAVSVNEPKPPTPPKAPEAPKQ